MKTTLRHGIWILAEQERGRVLPVSHELLARARGLADKLARPLTAAILGDRLADREIESLIQHGADAVLAVESPRLARFLVEPCAAALSGAIREYRPDILLAGATSTGRTLMPYVAAKLGAGLTADCTELDIDPDTGDLLQTRPAIGGNIMATIRTPTRRPQMATIRPHSNPPLPPDASRAGRIFRVAAPADLPAGRVRHLESIPATDAHPLQEAERVVSVGRGIRKGDNVGLARELADALDAALGASREVVDRGWLDYPHQVGLSGKTVVPRLYVAAGISGAIQHLAGMQTAEHIIAINTDPDARIFQVADLGIEGDLFEILPVLTRKLREKYRS